MGENKKQGSDSSQVLPPDGHIGNESLMRQSPAGAMTFIAAADPSFYASTYAYLCVVYASLKLSTAITSPSTYTRILAMKREEQKVHSCGYQSSRACSTRHLSTSSLGILRFKRSTSG